MREAKAMGKRSHSRVGPGQNDPAISAAYFWGQVISDLEAACGRGTGRGGINKPTRRCFANNKSNRHLVPPFGIIS